MCPTLKQFKKNKKRNNREMTLALCLALVISIILLNGFIANKGVIEPILSINASELETSGYNSDIRLPLNTTKEVVTEFIGNVSMYNLGDINQNWGNPCIGAFNENLCEAKDLTFANNYYKKGTTVCIESVGCGRVADRMNSRYGKYDFDIASRGSKKEALQFGRRNLKITIYKN